jgi:hypothetical protein
MKLNQFGGVAAIAFAAMTGTASADFMGTGSPALPCGGCSVTVSGTTTPNVEPTLPTGFSALNLGSSSSTTNGFLNNNIISTPGVGISTITFPTAGSSGPVVIGQVSGLYTGNTSNVATSPFGGATDGTSNPSPNQNYLVAQANNGSVGINYSSGQTSFDLLWGTVDESNNENLLALTISAGSATITGMDIANIIDAAQANAFTNGDLNVVVQITGLPSFTQITATDESTSSAFEFDPLVVPSPLIGHGLFVLLAVGGVLFGGKLLESRKMRHLHTA